MLHQNVQCSASAPGAWATRSVTADTHPCESHVVAPSSPVDALSRRKSLSAVAVGETTRRNTVCVKWNEAKKVLVKPAAERSRKIVATGQPAAPKAQRAGPCAEK